MGSVRSINSEAKHPLPARRELASLLPLWPSEIGDLTNAGRSRIIALLRRALRLERQRGRTGSANYSLSRHAALLRHLRREEQELAAISLPATK